MDQIDTNIPIPEPLVTLAVVLSVTAAVSLAASLYRGLRDSYARPELGLRIDFFEHVVGVCRDLARLLPLGLGFRRGESSAATGSPGSDASGGEDGYRPGAGGLSGLSGLAPGWGPVRAVAVNTCREAIRRKVLVVVPVWFVAVLGVSFFLNPLDKEQDLYRLLLRLFLYSQATVVTAATVLPAVFDLGNERRNRTLFTLLSKPVTRLEVALGKACGHALTAALLTAATGLPTLGYFAARDWLLRADAARRVAEMEAAHKADPRLPEPDHALKEIASEGVLLTRRLKPSAGPVQVAGIFLNDQVWTRTGTGQRITARFQSLRPSDPIRPPEIVVNFESVAIPQWLTTLYPGRAAGGILELPVKFTCMFLPNGDPKRSVTLTYPLPITGERLVEEIPAGVLEEDQRLRLGDAKVRVNLRDPFRPIQLRAVFPVPQSMWGVYDREGRLTAGDMPVEVNIQCDQVGFYSEVRPKGNIWAHFVDGTVPGVDREGRLLPSGDVRLLGFRLRNRQGIMGIPEPSDPTSPEPGPKNYYAADVARWRFDGVRAADLEPGRPAEIRIRAIVDVNEELFRETIAQIDIDSEDGRRSHTVRTAIEENRPLIVPVPAQFVDGSPFRVTLRCRTFGHALSVETDSLELTLSREPYVLAWLKTEWVVWMQAATVACVGVALGAFLSWPVAMLTTFFLLAMGLYRNLVMPLGVGEEMWRVMYVMNPGEQYTLPLTMARYAIWALGRLIAMTAFLSPDLREFNEFESIGRGLSEPMSEVLNDQKWMLVFSLPFVGLAYLVLRKREARE